jgi:hypothetical protein
MGGIILSMLTASVVDHEFKPCRVKLKTRKLAFAASLLSTVFSIQSCRSCYATLHLCQCPFYKIFVKFRNSNKKNVLKIVLIIVNINKDENKSLISNQFSLKNDLRSFLTF